MRWLGIQASERRSEGGYVAKEPSAGKQLEGGILGMAVTSPEQMSDIR